MSCWQSFLIAWVIAQLIPALAESPTRENFLAAGVFLASLVAAFAGMNATARWVRAVLAGGRRWDLPPAVAADPELRPRVAVTIRAEEQPLHGIEGLLGDGQESVPRATAAARPMPGIPPPGP